MIHGRPDPVLFIKKTVLIFVPLIANQRPAEFVHSDSTVPLMNCRMKGEKGKGRKERGESKGEKCKGRNERGEKKGEK